MTNALQQVKVVLVNGKPMVSSLQVAEHFGKNHFDVLKAIRSLEIPDDFRASNFSVSEYEAKTGIVKRKYPMYYMTRDGFVLLVMGFTGKKAMEWKIKYIQAFNAMEEELRISRQSSPRDDTLEKALDILAKDIDRKCRELRNTCSFFFHTFKNYWQKKYSLYNELSWLVVSLQHINNEVIDGLDKNIQSLKCLCYTIQHITNKFLTKDIK